VTNELPATFDSVAQRAFYLHVAGIRRRAFFGGMTSVVFSPHNARRLFI
jgi:hypothetical protein